MIALQSMVASVVLVALALPAVAAGEESRRSTPFTHFGARPVMELRGDGASAGVDFGSRADELVTRATLHLRYAWSPALAPAVSHIRLALNDNAIGVLPVDAGNAGKTIARDIEIDPRLIVGANKLTMSLVASKGGSPGESSRPGLWADVSGASELEVAVQPLPVADNLAILPEPFFDKRDQRRVSIPFVFAARPSTATLRAAAVVASWFGQLARWRGTRFPAQLDAQPSGHAIAFVTSTERPSFLASLPPATGPALRVMTNPADGRSKLLLVEGRDGAELKAAADALVLASSAMSGPAIQVKRVEDKGVRSAYDAPGLVRVDRPMKLGELIDWPQQLQAAGRPPTLDPIRVDLRVPPDLATWRGPGVPLALRVQYTPPPCAADSALEVAINDELLQVVVLKSVREPVAEVKELFIPSYRLRSRDQLQFGFRFALKDEASCRDARAETVKAVVGADSTIDFSGFPHYARLPNLNHFATVGFPFTRFADLAQTVVVLPDQPLAPDVEAMLGLMGRMGEATGYPATRVRIALAKEEAGLADADLLVIGASPQQSLLDKWAASLPVALTGVARRVSQPASPMAAVSDFLGFGAPPDTSIASQVSFEGGGPIAVVYGFESPITSGRSVVAVTAVAPDQMLRVLDALDNPETRKAVRGSAAFVLPGKVESVLVGKTYASGNLPPWTGAGYWASEHPAMATVLGVIAFLLLAWIAWRVARVASRLVRRRA
jgi:hypothetical protein